MTAQTPTVEGQPAQPQRRWMTAEDDYQALVLLIGWFADRADCTNPAEGIRALGLPDMTGVPRSRQARTSTQRRMAADAANMLQHAGFAIRKRDSARNQDGEKP